MITGWKCVSFLHQTCRLKKCQTWQRIVLLISIQCHFWHHFCQDGYYQHLAETHPRGGMDGQIGFTRCVRSCAFSSKVQEVPSFSFRALPFGLSPAPYIFSRIVSYPLKVFREKGVNLLGYLDDIVIWGWIKGLPKWDEPNGYPLIVLWEKEVNLLGYLDDIVL